MADDDQKQPEPTLEEAIAAFEQRYAADHAKLEEAFQIASADVRKAQDALRRAQAKAQQTMQAKIGHSFAGDAERAAIIARFNLAA